MAVVHGPEAHEGRSCLGTLEDNGWHLLFDRALTKAEWSRLGARLDDTFDPVIMNYSMVKAVALLNEVLSDVSITVEQ